MTPYLFRRGKDGPGHRVAAASGVAIRRQDRGTLPHIRDLLLTIVTVGIYRFWAITRWRRYFWSHMTFQGERFEYTGRGGELLLGLLMALGIFFGRIVGAAILAYALEQVHPGLGALPAVVLSFILVTLAESARFSAQRYRLSRTMWRGIRGGMDGSALAYGARSVRYKVLLPFTLFQLLPWVRIRLAEQRINASRLGSAEFSFSGRARAVYRDTWSRSWAQRCCSR